MFSLTEALEKPDGDTGARLRKLSSMRIREWPVSERPREKLLSRGPGALSDAELLGLFLGSGLRGSDAVMTARELLTRQGNLRGLLDRTPRELIRLPGLGPARACLLAGGLELARRWLATGLENSHSMNDAEGAGRYFSMRLRPHPQEVFAVLFLDTRHRMIAFEEMFRGTIDGAEVHPREVVRRALAHNAAAVIVGHNHPSGCAEPSAADQRVTLRLKQALALLDIRLLDHFIVGHSTPVSMAARGWL